MGTMNDIALRLARICAVNRGQENWQSIPGFVMTHRIGNSGTDTQLLTGELDNNTYVVSFRSSEPKFWDWVMTDARLFKRRVEWLAGDQVRVHRGFITAYNSVRPTVKKLVASNAYNRVFVCGHSLGGALASLCALDLAQSFLQGMEITACIYGSPRVGNSAFAELYDQDVPQTYRYVNGGDFVTTVPRINYRHVGKRIQLGRARFGWWFGDHRLENYIGALGEYC